MRSSICLSDVKVRGLVRNVVRLFIKLLVAVFAKNRWAGLKPIEGALQFERMPPPPN